jgi:hypothetical protein
VVESSGITTVNLSINRQMSTAVRAPRTVFLRYPHGAAFGEPGNRAQHLAILRDLLVAAQTLDCPGIIVEPGYRWRRTELAEPDPASFVVS